MNFSTPDQLKLFEQELNGFISVCSKLLYLAINGKLTEFEVEALENKMIQFKYYESLGFTNLPPKETVLDQVYLKLSKPKLVLIKLILDFKLDISNQDLILLYNELIYVKVKSMNRKRVKRLLE